MAHAVPTIFNLKYFGIIWTSGSQLPDRVTFYRFLTIKISFCYFIPLQSTIFFLRSTNNSLTYFCSKEFTKSKNFVFKKKKTRIVNISEFILCKI